MKNGIVKFFRHLSQGNFSFIFQGIRKRIYSRNIAFGLKRDLSIPFNNPDALIPITVRPMIEGDNPYFNTDNYNHGIIEARLKTCYVATDNEGTPCYRQWLMGQDQNVKIRDFWKGSFPVLRSDEALLENAFTVPDFRGKRIMPAAMARIAEKGGDIGAQYIITFVETDNIPSLKGCKRSGFYPYVLRIQKWFLFKRKTRFVPVTSKYKDYFTEVTS